MQVLYTPKEVAEKLGVCLSTVTKILKSGKLRCNRLGAKIRISEESLDAYIQESAGAYKATRSGPRKTKPGNGKKA